MERKKIIIKTSIQGILVNLVLVIFKAIVGLIANSIVIVLDAVNNLSDAMSSIITIIGTKLASKAPDKKHPYGHGRIEYFASVIIGVIVLLAGVTALKESIEKIINPTKASYTIASLIIIGVAVVVKFFFGRYVKKVGESINSGSLVASGSDALFDAVLSLSTFIAAVISMIWGISIEGILGAIIAVIILKSSVEILKDTIDEMIGTRIDGELSKKIKDLVNSFDEVEGAYDLLLHNYGPDGMMGSIHIQIPDDMTAKQIHILTRDIEMKVYKELNILLTVGIYASNNSDENYLEIRKDINKIIAKYENILQMHGFYVDSKKSMIMFDIVIGFEEKKPESLRDKVVEELKILHPEFDYYVIIDNDFSD